MKIAKVREVKTPTRGTPQSAGLDFYVPDNLSVSCLRVDPGHSAFIPSGIKVDVPSGHALIAFNKSGVALNKSLLVGACVVDEDYQGEIHLHVMNVGHKEVEILPGEKLIQLVLVPVLYEGVHVTDEVDLFTEDSQRGAGGFGSTGIF
ncbi:MAG TPA: dUTP diphosphatase [Pseudomonadales bacterium]|nr:dUTP diphosphatase [Pseudomonadales bacterium]